MENMDNQEFIIQYAEECAEHLAQIEVNLIALEKNPADTNIARQIKRSTHSIKGLSGMMGFGAIAHMAHTFEDSIMNVGKEAYRPDFTALFTLLDAMKSAIHAEAEKAAAKIDQPASAPAPLPKKEEPSAPKQAVAPEKPQEKPSLRGQEGDDIKADPSESLFVDGAALNNVLSLAKEIGAARDSLLRLKEGAFRQDQFTSALENLDVTASQLGKLAQELNITPLKHILRGFARAVSSLSDMSGKKVHFSVVGEDTAVSKALRRKIQLALVSLLRNAITHGIEMPPERKACGKTEEGAITLKVACRGSYAVITLDDDGRGIDPARVRAAAGAKGFLRQDRADALPDREILQLLFGKGLYIETPDSRFKREGAGLYYAKAAIEQIGGSMSIESVPGKGTSVSVRIPLSVPLTPVLFVRDGGETFAFPAQYVTEVDTLSAQDVKTAGDGLVAVVREELLPAIRLADVFSTRLKHAAPQGPVKTVVCSIGKKKLAVIVEDVGDNHNIFAQQLGIMLKNVDYVTSYTTSDSGRVILVLDVAALLLDFTSQLRRPQQQASAAPDDGRKRVLVVDDSVMTRAVEQSVLEAAGYAVFTAGGGQEALRLLRDQKIDLVITDISMPDMSGIDLAHRIREDVRLAEIPVIVFSSKEAEEEMARAMSAGAAAYMTKSSFTPGALAELVRTYTA